MLVLTRHDVVLSPERFLRRPMLFELFALDSNNPLSYLPYAVGTGVATTLALVLWTRSQRRHGQHAATAVTTPASWDEHDIAATDRRTSVRREGAPVRVLVAAAAFRDETAEGWVLDRSTGGMRLAVYTRIEPGSTVQVLAENAPDATPWTTLIIRSCKPMNDHYELGCEFEQTPPWNVLLLFG
ncbi:MAG: PilZ domain-containing protein [Gemmataceae bacterium]